MSIVVSIVVGAVLAWLLLNIIDILLLVFTFSAGSLFAPTVGGVPWKKATSKSAFISMVCSLTVITNWIIGLMAKNHKIFESDASQPGILVSLVIFTISLYFGEPTPEYKEKNKAFIES